ncbi:MAG: hypothetical protein GC205_06555 [Bacteroidetes bacterium]|nr:hypothetical protein [Bacteroidota bacterium]
MALTDPIRVLLQSPLAPELFWSWGLFARDCQVGWQPALPSDQPGDPGVLWISEDPRADVVLSAAFRQLAELGDWASERVMPDAPLLRAENGQEDPLSTAFYLVNSLQEHGSSARDAYDRFPYASSLQARFDCLEENLVGQAFDRLYERLRERYSWPARIAPRSLVMLSHDIDLVYRGWREDGKHALRHGQWARVAGLLWRQAAGRPDWLNIEKVMDVDQRWGMPATFFWIPRKARRGEVTPDADYSLDDPNIRKAMQAVMATPGFSLGLHASTGGAMAAEYAGFPYPVTINRQHFLKFRLPDHYEQVAQAGLAADASLGFAERPGFRNSYGMPFRPWSFKRREPHRFVEFPLHLMDATFNHYWLGGRAPEARAAFAVERGVAFLERNQRGAVLSLLWHNNYLTGGAYAAFGPVYQAWMQRCQELGLLGLDLESALGRWGAGGKG